jgi:hypothetical protein
MQIFSFICPSAKKHLPDLVTPSKNKVFLTTVVVIAGIGFLFQLINNSEKKIRKELSQTLKALNNSDSSFQKMVVNYRSDKVDQILTLISDYKKEISSKLSEPYIFKSRYKIKILINQVNENIKRINEFCNTINKIRFLSSIKIKINNALTEQRYKFQEISSYISKNTFFIKISDFENICHDIFTLINNINMGMPSSKTIEEDSHRPSLINSDSLKKFTKTLRFLDALKFKIEEMQKNLIKKLIDLNQFQYNCLLGIVIILTPNHPLTSPILQKALITHNIFQKIKTTINGSAPTIQKIKFYSHASRVFRKHLLSTILDVCLLPHSSSLPPSTCRQYERPVL